MIFPPAEGLMGALPGGEPFIVPIAIPMIAGPSGMAAVMLMGSQEPDRLGAWSLALMIAWGATAVILLSATALYKLLGTRALTAVERLMGMLLVRSEEHTSELQSLMRISYAVFCLTK